MATLRTDIRNAGGDWVDEQVVVDRRLVTSRKPDDIPAFSAKVIEEDRRGHTRSGPPGGAAGCLAVPAHLSGPAAGARPAQRALGLAGHGAEHDQRLRARDAAAAANPVDHLLEVIEVGDAQVDERVRVTRGGEALDELGEVGEGLVDLADLGARRRSGAR